MSTQHKLKETDAILELQQQLQMRDMKSRLSVLWIVILFNILFRDIHDFLRPGALEYMMSGTVTDATLVVAGMALSTFVAMVALSRLLPYRINRWTNIIIGLILLINFWTIGQPLDLDDTWYWVVEQTALVLIIWTAWTWRKPQQEIIAGIA